MPDWRSDYLTSLQEAERNNPVNKDLVDACSQLSDRIAALEAEKAVWQTSSTNPLSSLEKSPAGKAPAATTETINTSDPSVAQLKLDLAEALRSRTQLQSRLKTAEDELQKLRSKTKVDTKRISDLTAERNTLWSRLKDRNEELVGKNKMLKDIQDENLTLNIQLDVTEQKAAKLTADNEQLVKRWMDRMRDEADAMNLQNESPSHKNRR
ncbi:autophagy protein 16 [Hypoxylon trugodes]|uniref:autophagy protein 16 n=1 Tax=Hypoxylon trugodes TaxID=326681 RepID=UPI0021A06ABF|nr:autophagy protein 16 [Hypoxylon trugodes]KAI1384725.1 autophagy protein 16 [Hypoxylon trugodes]